MRSAFFSVVFFSVVFFSAFVYNNSVTIIHKNTNKSVIIIHKNPNKNVRSVLFNSSLDNQRNNKIYIVNLFHI